MQEGTPSRTAQRVAARRAAHQLLDQPLVFTDPLALRILGAEEEAALRADPAAADASPLARPLRAFMAVRSRVAEDELARRRATGLTQYVLLGAGLDTFACRSAGDPTLRVFEVDHPATQAWKRRRLAEVGLAEPPNAVFVPVDFERTALGQALADAGFDRTRPACFSWLGVVPYLEPAAIDATLAFVAGCAAGSAVTFDYGLPPESLDLATRAAFEILARRVAAGGEPFRTFFAPEALAEHLRALGFTHVEDRGGDDLNARYFAGRTDRLRVGTAAHVATAGV